MITSTSNASERGEFLEETTDPADLTTRYQIGTPRQLDTQAGKIGWAILWLLGVPLPVLLAIYLIWGR